MTRKLTTNQSEITEERVLRGSSRWSRTYVLLILEVSINNLSGTDGHRTIGRPWHASPSRNSSRAEVICLSTRNVLPLSHSKKIRSPLPLTIRYLCPCLTTLKPLLNPAGRSRPPRGQPCSKGSSKGNRCDRLPVITACRMRRSGGCCERHVATQWGVSAQISPNRGYSTRRRRSSQWAKQVRRLFLVSVVG